MLPPGGSRSVTHSNSFLYDESACQAGKMLFNKISTGVKYFEMVSHVLMYYFWNKVIYIYTLHICSYFLIRAMPQTENRSEVCWSSEAGSSGEQQRGPGPIRSRWVVCFMVPMLSQWSTAHWLLCQWCWWSNSKLFTSLQSPLQRGSQSPAPGRGKRKSWAPAG